MSGTSAMSIPRMSGGLDLPPPKLRLRSKPTGAVIYDLFDGNQIKTDPPVEAVLSGLPDAAFDPDNAVELRLFRYSRAKSRASANPSPARWSALPHHDGTGNPYAGSQWLGGSPEFLAPDGMRRSAILLDGLTINSTVDLMDLARYWLRFGSVAARAAGGALVFDKITRSTWTPNKAYASPSWGVSRNIEPARFAVAFVAKDRMTGQWFQASGMSRFTVSNDRPPFIWDAADPGNVPPSPGSAGTRIWTNNPGFDAGVVTVRITESETLAGWR